MKHAKKNRSANCAQLCKISIRRSAQRIERWIFYFVSTWKTIFFARLFCFDSFNTHSILHLYINHANIPLIIKRLSLFWRAFSWAFAVVEKKQANLNCSHLSLRSWSGGGVTWVRVTVKIAAVGLAPSQSACARSRVSRSNISWWWRATQNKNWGWCFMAWPNS